MRVPRCHYRNTYKHDHTFIYLEAGQNTAKAPEAIQKKEAILKKDVIDEKALQEKMTSIQNKIDASPLDAEHKEKVKAELKKMDSEHADAIGKLSNVTEKSLKAAGEKFQEDLKYFEIRPEVVFLFDTINSSEFKEIQKQQPNIRALETKTKAAADLYRSHLMANGESAPGHETDLEGHMLAIQALYAGLEPVVQQKEHLSGGDESQLKTLEKILGEKNNFTLANFKENAGIHGGIESSESKLRIPGSLVELQGRQQVIENNLTRIRSILYRTTGNPKYEAAYTQETKAKQNALTGQVAATMDALQAAPYEVEIKKHAQEKLGKLGTELQDLQNMRGKDPINAQRGAVDLLQRLRGFTKGYRVGDADQDLKMVELKKYSDVEKAFHNGVQQYIGETENLILDATTNNPSMKTYQQEAISVISNTQPFVSSIGTLFKQMQAGKTPSESDMKMFHEDANRILLDPTFNKLAGSDANQFFGNLKIPDEATSPRLHEAMTKIKDMQDKVSAYMKTLNVLTRQVVGIKGHGVGLEAFLKDAGKFLLVTTAAVAGAVAMTALAPATGGASLVAAKIVATSLGAAIGANYMTAAIEGNTDAIGTENMLKSWGQGMLFSGGGALAGQALGTVLGKSAQVLSKTLNIAPDKIFTAPSIQTGIKTLGLKGYLQQVASETKEEMFEEAMQKIGEGLAPNNPYLGFVFSLIPSASGKARDILHAGGIESTITNSGVEVEYDNVENAVKALVKAQAPAEVVDAVKNNVAAKLTQNGVDIVIRPSPEIEAAARKAGLDVVTEQQLRVKAEELREKADKAKADGKPDAKLEAKAQDAERAFREAEIKAETSLVAEKELLLKQHLDGMCPCHHGTMSAIGKVDSTGKDVFERSKQLDAALARMDAYQASVDQDGHVTKMREKFSNEALDSTTEAGKKVDAALAGQQVEVEVRLPDGTRKTEQIAIRKELLTPDTLLKLASGEPLEMGMYDTYLHKHLSENLSSSLDDAIKPNKQDSPETVSYKEKLKNTRGQILEAARKGDAAAIDALLDFATDKQKKFIKDGLMGAFEKSQQGTEVFKRSHAEMNAEGKDISRQFMSDTVNKMFDDFARNYEKENPGQKIDQAALEKIKGEIMKAGIDQHIDNPPQYVSHGFDHSLRVMENISTILKGSPGAVKGMMEKYNVTESQARLIMLMTGVCHDYGYPTVGDMNKSLHAITGTYRFITDIAMPLAKAINLDLSNPDHQKLIKNFANSIECHSADKTDTTYENEKGGKDKLDFDRKITVELIIPGTDITYTQEFLFMKSTFDTYPGGQDAISANILDFYRKNNIPITGKFLVEGGKFEGRYVDLPGSKQKGSLPAGIAYRGAEMSTRKVDENGNIVTASRHTLPSEMEATGSKEFKFDPLLALVRYADNLDMQESRFSDFQKTPIFKRLFERMGAERSMRTEVGEQTISNALNDALSGNEVHIPTIDALPKSADGKPILYEGELLTLTKALIEQNGKLTDDEKARLSKDEAKALVESRTKELRARNLPRLLELVRTATLQKFGDPPVSLTPEAHNTIIEALKDIVANSANSPKDLKNKIQSVLSTIALADEKANIPTEQKYLDLIDKYIGTVNEVSFRHFGGCRPIDKIDVQNGVMALTLNPEVVKRYLGLVAAEKVPGQSVPINIPVNIYQIWRGIEAYESLTVDGKKMKLKISMKGTPDFEFDPNKVNDDESTSMLFAEAYQKWESANVQK